VNPNATFAKGERVHEMGGGEVRYNGLVLQSMDIIGKRIPRGGLDQRKTT